MMASPDETGSPLLIQASEHLQGVLHPSIWNHSRRVERLAADLATRESLNRHSGGDAAFYEDGGLDAEALAVAAMFHDAGTAARYDGPDRFEVEGAHAAARFLTRHGWPAARIRPVWDAIALHTSPGIAENAGPLPALIRAAVRIDFGAPPPAGTNVVALEQALPRERIEVVLADVVVEQIDTSSDPARKAPPTSWAAHLAAGRDAIDPATGLNPNF